MKIGQSVCWESSATGTTKAKHGVVRIIIPANTAPSALIAAVIASVGNAKKLNARPMRMALNLRRNHESYVIEVKTRVGARLYWPLVSLLSETPGLVDAVKKTETVPC